MSGHLIVVGTPIGNLDDISQRALDTLKTVDLIVAEDTRRSLNLLRHFGIETRLASYHEHSSAAKHQKIIDLLGEGKSIALISDAGLPGIADPGEELIHDWIALGGKVSVVPGANAALSGLVLSGLSCKRFAFEGFLPRGGRLRRQVLKTLRAEHRTLIFYEAPHRISETLEDMLALLGDRKAAIARELTKLHEEVLRGLLSELLAITQTQQLRGEIVLIVDGRCGDVPEEATDEASPESTIARLLEAGLTPSQAAKEAVAITRLPRNQLYKMAVEYKKPVE